MDFPNDAPRKSKSRPGGRGGGTLRICTRIRTIQLPAGARRVQMHGLTKTSPTPCARPTRDANVLYLWQVRSISMTNYQHHHPCRRHRRRHYHYHYHYHHHSTTNPRPQPSRQFGRSSYPIHEKSCKKKYLAVQAKVPIGSSVEIFL